VERLSNIRLSVAKESMFQQRNVGVKTICLFSNKKEDKREVDHSITRNSNLSKNKSFNSSNNT
jgi:hypothetical protein